MTAATKAIERRDWFVTASGRQAFILDPMETDIIIEDIAHALSNLCRFGGHSNHFYSVAQHSVLVSFLVPERLALVGLLHDATEAYLGDVIRPLKRELADYAGLEEGWWFAIAARFGLPTEHPPEVKAADRVALVTERKALIMPHTWKWMEDEMGVEAAPGDLVPVSPEPAREAFLARFDALTRPR